MVCELWGPFISPLAGSAWPWCVSIPGPVGSWAAIREGMEGTVPGAE